MRPISIILQTIKEIDETRYQLMCDDGDDYDAYYVVALGYVVEALRWAIDAEPSIQQSEITRFLGQACDEPDDNVVNPSNN